MFLVSSCSCSCPIHSNQVLSREWRCSWSSAERRCSNYNWVINNFVARGLMVYMYIFSDIMCPALMDIDNSTIVPNKTEYRYGEEVMYKCLDGYQFPDKDRSKNVTCTTASENSTDGIYNWFTFKNPTKAGNFCEGKHDDVITWKRVSHYWPLWRWSSGRRRIPLTRVLYCRGLIFSLMLGSLNKEWPVIWDVMMLMWRHCNQCIAFGDLSYYEDAVFPGIEITIIKIRDRWIPRTNGQ